MITQATLVYEANLENSFTMKQKPLYNYLNQLAKKWNSARFHHPQFFTYLRLLEYSYHL